MELVDDLRRRTRLLHEEAERSGIVAALVRGQSDRDGYALYLRNLLPAYEALEAGLERHGSLINCTPFDLSAAYRSAPIRADLGALSGTDWHALPLTPAALRYSLRVAAAASGDGTLLVAHAYVRYLGDLSGGQILRSLLTRRLGLTTAELGFLTFPGISDVAAFRHSLLNAIANAVAAKAKDAVLSEAELAFRLNIDVSNAVLESVKVRAK